MTRISSPRSSSGRMAAFQKLGAGTATGDQLIVRLESRNGAAAQLKPGIHLHWELPDHFRRGRQAAEGGPLASFPTRRIAGW